MTQSEQSKLSFWSPSRPRLANGLPTWQNAPRIALPQLSIGPTERGTWRVGIGLGGVERGQYFGRWKWTEVSLGTLADLLAQWEAGPEQALREWWEEEPPAPASAPAGGDRTDKTMEELGL